MMRALYSSVAGLKSHQTKMDVIGNNISNVNTVGFKSSRVTFSTMMYQTLTGASGPSNELGSGGVNAKQIGLGANFASTAVDIETGGASESTGKAFDLKISDKNTTSFYIVNTGTENVFTRAGAFTVDGSGTLCMESTGYKVMGWQVDANGNINKNTVTPLRIMSAENQTSQPEFTTEARCTGILDDNSTTVNADTGYNMNLNFFDNLGYSYTGKFAVQKNGDKGQYTVNLVDILDSNGASMVTKYGQRLGNLFGSGSQGSNVDVTNNYTVASGMSNALKKLALTAPAGEDEGSFGDFVFNYPSELINQYLGTNTMQLPEGLTVQFHVPSNENGNDINWGEPDDNGERVIDGDTRVTILDSSGSDVTATYTAQSRFLPLFSSEPVEGDGEDGYDGDVTNLYKIVTAQDKLQEWYDRNQLEKFTSNTGTTGDEEEASDAEYYRLNSSQLAELKSMFPNSEILSEATATNCLVQFTQGEDEGSGLTLVNSTTRESLGLEEDENASRTYTLLDYMDYAYLNVNAAQVNEQGIFTTQLPEDLEVRYTFGDGSVKLVTPSTDGFTLQFSTEDGTLNFIGQQGNTSQTLKLSLMATEENPFTDINIDFSTLKNLANGGTSTAALSNGDGGGEGTGKKVGTMIGLSVDNKGMVYASYSNGNTSLVGQIPVARFANAAGLESIGDNCYRTTMNSGEFDGIGEEVNSDGSTIDAGTLEMSNVDLATEFTTMITTQRGYQANSRVISTSDSILEELVNLKR